MAPITEAGYVNLYGRDTTDHKNAEKALLESRQRYYSLFEYSPISLWEEDFSEVKRNIDKIKKRGVKDFDKYFNDHPEFIRECASLVKIIDTNKATLSLYKAMNKEHIISNLNNIFIEESYDAFKKALIELDQDKTLIEFKSTTKTNKNNIIQSIIRWGVLPGYEETL